MRLVEHNEGISAATHATVGRNEGISAATHATEMSQNNRTGAKQRDEGGREIWARMDEVVGEA